MNVGNSTFFGVGVNDIVFRFRDSTGNIGYAQAKLTVTTALPTAPPLGPIYTQGASYRINTPSPPLGPIYTQGASYRINTPSPPLGPIYTQGASYRISTPLPPLGPIYTQGASYAITACAANVSPQVGVTRGGFQLNRTTGRYVQQITLKNSGANAIPAPLSLVVDGLSSNASLFNKSGTTTCTPAGSPYINVNVGADNELTPGEIAVITLEFTNSANQSITYSTRIVAGAGSR